MAEPYSQPLAIRKSPDLARKTPPNPAARAAGMEGRRGARFTVDQRQLLWEIRALLFGVFSVKTGH